MQTWDFKKGAPMTIQTTTWLYVAIQKSGTAEQIVGQTDSEHDVSFIPAFLSKEAAQQAMFHLHLEKKGKYEVQAIIYEDLARHAVDGGFLIFVLDEEGKVVERLPAKA
jgi:spore cortex formation protein SpoVR/YcgB (stage V sporulation)